MSDPEALIPVDILTGFLGAGKTTLIRRLVASGKLVHTAILVNEFAALPMDQRMIALSGGAATVIGEGCICCAVDGDVRDALLGLAEQRATGAIPTFSRVLIETSGIADPAALIATLALDRMLKPRFRLGRVVTLVDLAQGGHAIDGSPESLSQIISADIVLLSKSDLATDQAASVTSARIETLNPLARIVVDDGALDPFVSASHCEMPIGMAQSRRFTAIAAEPGHGTVRSCVLRLPDAVDWPAFATWLSLLAHRHGSKLLRLKGTLTLADGSAPPVLVQSVRHIVHQPEHLPVGSAADGLELVVIARDVDPVLLQRSLSAFLAKAPSRASLAAAG